MAGVAVASPGGYVVFIGTVLAVSSPDLMRPMILAMLVVLCLSAAGCTVGYRYHRVDAEIASAAGASGRVEGSGHIVQLGIVLDFRYFRFGTPYLGSSYDMALTGEHGGSAHQSSTDETQAFELDVPVVSLWSADVGLGLGYPGTMVHRQSLEVWASYAARPSEQPLWWSELSAVYYADDLAAVRVFGGWGGAPYDGQTAHVEADGLQYDFWKASPGGYTVGAEVTIGAGEQALDFVKFFIDNQSQASKPRR